MKTAWPRPLMFIVLWLLSGVMPVLAQTQAQTQTAPTDVARSWDRALVYLPGKSSSTHPGDVRLDRAMPVVVFMHGCTGIAVSERSWADFLNDQGYVVVLPDSFARDRPSSCNPRTLQGGFFPQVFQFRAEEMNFAVEQLQKLPWADPANIFLMGHSEGSRLVTVAPTPRQVRGVIISASRCQTPEHKNLLVVPPEIPVLALDHEIDPWYPWAKGFHCSDVFENRTNASQVTLPGSGHDTYEAPAREAVLQFLKKYTSPPPQGSGQQGVPAR